MDVKASPWNHCLVKTAGTIISPCAQQKPKNLHWQKSNPKYKNQSKWGSGGLVRNQRYLSKVRRERSYL